ncbi:pseudouridine synthase [Dipodascopsis tothii]|uniref:pseudouridine synthase n=1 Tax=Dipodascopsis tothii TaxID=44089 RepID=UPI0034CFA809
MKAPYSPSRRQYDDGGFRLRRQILESRDSTPQEVLCQAEPAENEVTIHDEIAQGAKYVKEPATGLRRVPPYYFTYLTFCKGRWRDRTLIDIFTSEFRDRERSYYEYAISSGLVTVNRKIADISTVIRNGDSISHRIHRHEPPVSVKPIEIVHEDEDMIVIDKPSGIPVHPTGRYRFNTITEILKHEHGLVVHPCHRLDRLTSGIMFLAKQAKAAQAMAERLRERTVFKDYVARVLGEFPDGEVTCDLPILTVDPKIGLNRVKPEGKPATTVFNRLSFDGRSSVVRCRPLTGRTHQIRVHLQHLGHPILNDPIYANRGVFGPALGKDGAGDDESIKEKLALMGKHEHARSVAFDEIVKDYQQRKGEKLTGERCAECATELYSDPAPADLELWLHALRYGSHEGLFEYETRMPAWAQPDFAL